MSDPTRELLDEQIAYYRARAAEYDATSQPAGDPFAAHGAVILAALEALAPRGRVLEIGAGTGQYTGVLAAHADELVALDASPEMLARNAARTRHPRVTYRVSDVFSLEPAPRRFDLVAFGFFLSHVPLNRFAAFWSVVGSQLAPRGRVFFVDERPSLDVRERWIDRRAGIVRRTLDDGSMHRVVKVLWEPLALEGQLAELGWNASVRAEGPFYWGIARRDR